MMLLLGKNRTWIWTIVRVKKIVSDVQNIGEEVSLRIETKDESVLFEALEGLPSSDVRCDSD